MNKDEIISNLQEALLKSIEKNTRPPVVIMSQSDVEKKYWGEVNKNKKFKKIFWKIYIKNES